MAIIAQKNLFNWKEIETSSDIERLRMVMEGIGDESLMRKLERKRKGRRDDYPVRAVWNSILAGVVYQHVSIESLRRELLRNGELREGCGFNPILGDKAVPNKWVYHRFLKRLIEEEAEINKVFENLIGDLKELLPDLGEEIGIDSKAIESHAVGKKDPNESSDPEADWGIKNYTGKREDGSVWEKVTKWFGYKVHLIVDVKYELPLRYKITKASVNDSPELLTMVKELAENHPELIERTETICADKGYDSEANNKEIWDEYGIKPIIDIRNMWKDGDKAEGAKVVTRPLNADKADNITYDFQGKIYCHCPLSDEQREMAFCGFEEDRGTLKYRCPAMAYGIECKGKGKCSDKEYGRIVRVDMERDRRVFTPIARSSYAWENKYKKRSAVERVNSRIDNVYGFEFHYLRGLKKMNLRMGLALVVMLAMAKGRIKNNQEELLRSLVQPAKAA